MLSPKRQIEAAVQRSTADKGSLSSKLAVANITEAHDREPSRLRNRWLFPTGRRSKDVDMSELLWNMFKENEFFLGGKVIDCCKNNADALNLVKSFAHQPGINELFRSVIQEEVQACDQPQMIFRRNSGRSRVLAAYMKMAGRDALGSLLAPMIQAVDRLPPLEVDGVRQPGFSREQLTGNARKLEELCTSLLDRIHDSLEDFPAALVEVAKIVFEEVEKQFPGCGQDAIITIFFLRFICPAIVTPWIFCVTDKMLHPLHQRSLLLLSKLLQMTCVAAGGDESRRCMTIVRREESMGCFRDFIEGKRDFIQTMCLNLAQANGVPMSMEDDRASALWTCPNNRCRSLLPKIEQDCPRCDTAAPANGDRGIVDGLSDQQSCAISLAQFCKRNQTTLMRQIEAGCSGECECTFTPQELLLGAAEDLTNAINKGYIFSLVGDLTNEFETELLGGPGRQIPSVLIQLLESGSISKLPTTVEAILRIAIGNGVGCALAQGFLDARLESTVVEMAPAPAGHSRKSSSSSNMLLDNATGIFRVVVAEYLKQMCYGAVDTMTRAAVFDTLNGRTNFAKMDAMNPDDPDTVLIDGFIVSLIDRILKTDGPLEPMHIFTRLVYKHNELVEPGTGMESAKGVLFDFLSSTVFDSVSGLSRDAERLASLARRSLKFAFGSTSGQHPAMGAGLGDGFTATCDGLELRLAQNFASLERSPDYMSKMEIRLSREAWKPAGVRKTETARLMSLLHLGQMCHRVVATRPSGRTDTLPYSGKNHLSIVLDEVIGRLQKTALMM